MRFLITMFLSTLALLAATPEGNPRSPVRVVIFEDLQCGDCARFRTMLDEQLLPKYKETVAFEHRDFPLAKHSWSRDAALVARYFDLQNPNLGVEFRRQALANRDKVTAAEFATWVAGFSRQYAVDPVKAVAALKSTTIGAQVDKDVAEGVARGITKTPTVFVDGEPFVETFTFEAISLAIDAALVTQKK
ncbi:MAG: DsbA family protein [Bryobacteraceae bacterium]|nr:DsbA family protein [Bryobacteraceae bacterium]